MLSAALAEDKKTCLDEIIVDLSNDDISAILKYVAEWNTNTLHSYVSQSVIAVVLRCLRPDKILALPDIQHTLQSLMPYTERHFQRADRLLQQSSFVDYTWQAARLLPSDTLGLAEYEREECEVCVVCFRSLIIRLFVYQLHGHRRG